jgi:chorismate synthase
VDRDLARRMQGYGRGARMKIERDRIEWIAGVRAGETLGSPVAMLIHNRDWANWEEIMAAEGPAGELRRRRVTRPRPGHVDLSGVLKYDRVDARDVLERASARETAARVAAGALARRLLDEFGVEVGSHVVSMGGIEAHAPAELPVPLNDAADRSEVRVLDPSAEAAIIARVDRARKEGDTLGGEVEVVARGVVAGLGSHVSWDRKLDGRLAGILMSIPAVKGVEIGLGFVAARRPGSQVHDPIEAGRLAGGTAGAPPVQGDARAGFRRATNNAGGLEAGITTGEPVVVRLAMKPIATLMSPLPTVDLATGAPAQAQSERSDVTAVPALGVIGEALVAFVLADAMLEKFGGDSLGEMRRNYQGYVAALGARWNALRADAEAG